MQSASETPTFFRSSAIRPGPLELLRTAIRETFSRRRLIRYLVRAQIKKQGTDTVLGNVWWILDPLLSMGVYVIVMTFIFQRRIPDFPIFLLAAIIPFKWFTTTISSSANSVAGQGQLIKQIQFPKLVLPLTTSVAEVINLGFGMIVLLAVLLLFYPAHASLMILWVPVIAVVQFVFTLGIALIVSAVTVFYRDVGNLISHLMRLAFYLAPILWSFDDLSGRGGDLEKAVGSTGLAILHYNPLAIFLDSYRHVIYGVVQNGGTSSGPPVPPDLAALGVVLVISLGLLALGTWVFKRLEPAFAKVL
jgi:lipopolysaccharide transport system permease protein/teichoic acid transport system permease protein